MQKVITGYTHSDFQILVNDLLNVGWKVVPGTLVIAAAGGSSLSQYPFRFAIVLEKNEKNEIKSV